MSGGNLLSDEQGSRTEIMAQNDRITYRITLGHLPYSQQVVIDGDGSVSHTSSGNFLPGSPPEIGTYNIRIDTPSLKKILDMIDKERFSAIDTSACQPEEGEGIRMIRVERGGASTTKLIGQRDRAQAGFLPLETELKEWMARARSGPQQVERMEFRLTQDVVSRGQPLKLHLAITNVGKEMLRTVNPIFVKSLGAGVFELEGVRSDLAVTELRNEHLYMEELDIRNLETMEPESAKTHWVLELEPGGSVRMNLSLEIAWAPGEYRVRPHFACDLENVHGVKVTWGQILPAPTKLMVKEQAD